MTDTEYLPLLEAIESSEDLPDLKRAELALAIFLLSRNYVLDGLEFERLFDFGKLKSHSAEAQESFRELASDHIRWARGSAHAGSLVPMSSLRSLTTRLFYRLWPT